MITSYLCAAFDTIDHFILLERLSSWFGISGTAQTWVESYITFRSFYVQVRDSHSSVYQLLYGVHQCSVLGPFLFILYTPPLITFFSKSSVHPHMHMLMTLSFSFLSFLTNALKMFLFLKTPLRKSSKMSANLLTLITRLICSTSGCSI
jgi:hypothetical protein